MDVVWLASYPKSGNTWVRFLLTNLLHGPFENSQKIFEVTPVLERGVAHSLLREDRANLIKTHWTFSSALDFMELAVGAIYIVRDPFDVALSTLNYILMQQNGIADWNADRLRQVSDRYVLNYLRTGGDTNWIRAGMGTWTEHAQSWLHNDAGLPVRIVRYDDLVADTKFVLRGICDFISLDASDRQLEEAVARSSFEAMRAMEEREIRNRIPGMFYVPALYANTESDRRFMNQGKAGRSRQQIATELRERFVGSFSPMIAELGYA